MKSSWVVAVSVLLGVAAYCAALTKAPSRPYVIVDTAQVRCYDHRTEIAYPKPGAAFFGQDAHYNGIQPAYKDNGNGTVTDLNTGLMWQKDPGQKRTFQQAVDGAARCRTGGHKDWRLPGIKELYSLVLFSGTDPSIHNSDPAGLTPFIDAKFFKFQYGDSDRGERIIDSQYASATQYVSTTMNGNKTMFGVNFADGRIKGYPIGRARGRREKTYYVMYVRGNGRYGRNDFKDNRDGTVTDRATGLMWMKVDSGALKAGRNRDGKLNWPEALAWAEGLTHAGYSDWRLPNAKELHSIVDYTRSPDTSGSAAIDPVFQVTAIRNEGGAKDYPYYWTGTTHARTHSAESAVYIPFGRALGFMPNPRTGERTLLDVHGAGAQRCDMKSGDPSKLPKGRGPQGDVMRIYNFARCVRGGVADRRAAGPKVAMKYAAHRPPGGPPSGGQFVRRHDRDGDGKVSRKEFPGPDDHFRQFDKNRDGYLTGDEAPRRPPPRHRLPGRRP